MCPVETLHSGPPGIRHGFYADNNFQPPNKFVVPKRSSKYVETMSLILIVLKLVLKTQFVQWFDRLQITTGK